jgi:predicted metal-dependent phosphoesterase TrpH
MSKSKAPSQPEQHKGFLELAGEALHVLGSDIAEGKDKVVEVASEKITVLKKAVGKIIHKKKSATPAKKSAKPAKKKAAASKRSKAPAKKAVKKTIKKVVRKVAKKVTKKAAPKASNAAPASKKRAGKAVRKRG